MLAFQFLGFNFFELMAAGAIMVSLPIIIHLINRMRYRRIRWAAMEFLLKAQKKQRRRLIIEQLILLAMRCALIALIGFWLGGFIGFGGSLFGAGEKQALHVVVIDDTPSMGDRWKDKGVRKTNAFDEGKEILREKIARRILESAARNGSAEYVVVYRLSDLEQPIFADRLNDATYAQLKANLGEDRLATPSSVSETPLKALEKAEKVFEGNAPEVFDSEGRKALFKQDLHTAPKFFHFISDFRERDWGGSSEKLRAKVEELIKKNAKIYCVDTADPIRSEARGVLQNHDNIGITSFQAEAAVAAEFEPVKFSVVINNFTNRTFEKVPFHFFVNGLDVPTPHPFLTLPAGLTTVTFKIGFNEPGFNHIEAKIDDPEGLRDTGLAADNSRYTVIKIEKTVRILVIDGDYPNPAKDPKDGHGDASKAPDISGTYYLCSLLEPRGDPKIDPKFQPKKTYQLVSGRLEDLEKPTLFQYPCVFLFNVPDIPSKTAVDNLEKFASAGGGVCFFLGDKTKPDDFNKALFKDGSGLFPAPLNPRPTEDMPKTENPDEIKRQDAERLRRRLSSEPAIYVRDEAHPMFASVYKEADPERKVNVLFPFLTIDKYYGVDPVRYKKGDQADKVEELFTLPNRKNIQDYRLRAQKLIAKLPVNATEFKEFAVSLQRNQTDLGLGLTGDRYTQLPELANAVFRLLHDPGNPKGEIKSEPVRPSLEKFWADPRNEPLRREFEQFSEEIRYGDPFMVAKQFGKGHVVACMSSGGPAWNEWATSPLYPIFMPALRKYLFSLADAPNHDCGTSIPVEMDAAHYSSKLQVFKLPAERPKEAAADRPREGSGADKDKEAQAIAATDERSEDYETKSGWKLIDTFDRPAVDGKYTYEFTKGQEPGVYVFRKLPLPTEAEKAVVPERRAVTYNIDATNEGDLRRSDALERKSVERKKNDDPQAASFVVLDRNSPFEELNRKVHNHSESPWLYLGLLMLLLAEQAMAVHCSYHTRGTDLPASAEISMHSGKTSAAAA